MARLTRSFRWRLLLLVGGLVLLAQSATFIGVLNVLDADVRAESVRELDTAAELVAQAMQRRVQMLGNGADVLVADFGFRSAIASGDRETIRSALENNAARIGADIAVLHAPDGRAFIANERARQAANGMPDALQGTDPEAREHSVGAIGRLAWQRVVVPVRAPTTIARLQLGFALDEAVANELARQVDLQVSFGNRDAQGWHHPVTGGGARKPVVDIAALDALPNNDGPTSQTLDGEAFLVRTLTLDDSGGDVRVVLQRSLRDALAPYYTLRDRLIAITAGTLAIGLLVAGWLAHGLSRPLASLGVAAQRIGSGRYDMPTGVERDDEIGELANAIDTMRTTISEREARITHLAMHDELTGLPNQRLGLDRLDRAISAARRGGDGVLALVAGIDQLSRIGDTLGHSVAEAVVIEMAGRLSDRLRDSDSIARIGDDTFLIVMPSVDPLHAQALASSIADGVVQPLPVGDAVVTPSLSIGMAGHPGDADDARELMRRAGIALADAREREQRVNAYVDGRDEQMKRQLSIVADLTRAVANDELMLHFQPKVSVKDARVRSVEALVRWIHPDHGFMPPDEFIGLAEKSGNISMLSDWVMDRAARQSRAWRDAGREIAIAVNLSALDLRDDRLVQRVTDTLARYALPCDALVIEITESAVVEDARLALRTLTELRAFGARVSIDDFGTGQSSLAKLRELPADELKIDRAFVTDLKPDTPDAMIVRAIVELGHGLGMTIVTEGVETASEQSLVAALNVDSVQGYFHCKPVLPDALLQWLDQRDTTLPEAA